MNLNIVDVIIILIIGLGALVGFKEGAIKRTTSIVGLVLVVILSFILKNYLSVFFYENLPFFDLWGVFKGIQVLNIVFYEMVAFLIIASILTIVYRVILGITGIIERILKATIILSIPSKILGAIFGFIEMYLILDIVIVILSIPFLNLEFVKTSKLSGFIVNKTPIVSIVTNKITKCFNDINETINTNENENLVNDKIIEILEDYEFVSKETLDKIK